MRGAIGMEEPGTCTVVTEKSYRVLPRPLPFGDEMVMSVVVEASERFSAVEKAVPALPSALIVIIHAGIQRPPFHTAQVDSARYYRNLNSCTPSTYSFDRVAFTLRSLNDWFCERHNGVNVTRTDGQSVSSNRVRSK